MLKFFREQSKDVIKLKIQTVLVLSKGTVTVTLPSVTVFGFSFSNNSSGAPKRTQDRCPGMNVPQDGLLNEQHIAPSLLDLLHQVQDVGSLLTQHSVHLGIIRNNDLIVHLFQIKRTSIVN